MEDEFIRRAVAGQGGQEFHGKRGKVDKMRPGHLGRFRRQLPNARCHVHVAPARLKRFADALPGQQQEF